MSKSVHERTEFVEYSCFNRQHNVVVVAEAEMVRVVVRVVCHYC